MSQARHRQPLSEIGQPSGPLLWQASDHRVGYSEGYAPSVLVSNGATWGKISPLRSYKPTPSKQRDPQAGAHLHFHKLTEQRRHHLFDTAVRVFAEQHGLLGLFYEYCSGPVLPLGTHYVSPNAIIEDGKMRRVEPETEGQERLDDCLYERHGPSRRTGEKMHFSRFSALPEELEFYPAGHYAYQSLSAEGFGGPPGGRVLAWKDVEDSYGVVALLDMDEKVGVSIVPTREPLLSWELECKEFPSVPYGPQIAGGLNERVAGVSPYTSIGEDGEFERGWRCRSLLQAMYLMVYLDFTGGNKVRRCKRPDCREPYRLGAHESDYCSETCTSWATTRRSRGLLS
jgi:hypothetical protein